MEELLAQIEMEMRMFKQDAVLVPKGNKAAGRRSRKTSLVLTRLFKEWRELSIKGEAE